MAAGMGFYNDSIVHNWRLHSGRGLLKCLYCIDVCTTHYISIDHMGARQQKLNYKIIENLQ